jgi:hypothetical protein
MMVELVSASNEVAPAAGANSGDGYDAMATLNDGFLGTGYTTGVELSLVAFILIAGYVATSLIRYFMPDFRPLRSVASVLGLSGS